MTDMIHWADRLSEYLDGDLSPAERTACTTHLETCPSCRETLKGVSEVRHAVTRLPGIAPSADLWPGISERLDQGASPLLPIDGTGPRRMVVSVRRLAAAAVLVAVASGSLVWFALRPVSPSGDPPAGPASAPVVALAALDASIDPIIGELEQLLRERAPSLDPAVLTSIETDLRAINQSLANIRSALSGDPSNGSLNRQLARLLRAKVDRLRDAALQPTGRGAA